MELQRKAKEELYAKVESMLQQNELYLMLNGVFTQHAFFRNSTGNIREIHVTSDIGMFQNSYLVTDFEDGEVDFWYFDEPQGIQPYHWSDGLDAILIENVGAENINITFMDESIVCEVGEVTRVEKSAYTGEGLYSEKCEVDDGEDCKNLIKSSDWHVKILEKYDKFIDSCKGKNIYEEFSNWLHEHTFDLRALIFDALYADVAETIMELMRVKYMYDEKDIIYCRWKEFKEFLNNEVYYLIISENNKK